ncbi:nitrogen assimilation transcription factor nit-4 [Fusarium beomiforme]|uniref:Nitrogen assimilation transcription factor nit-4 n=1 Tax=Fusarium beomiforme TaxID=44412 RepID=A0A9P5AG21_9HYPO|nr:nitrogen assimilation transcription factor nit-4 [Fusarium beomiforme]
MICDSHAFFITPLTRGVSLEPLRTPPVAYPRACELPELTSSSVTSWWAIFNRLVSASHSPRYKQAVTRQKAEAIQVPTAQTIFAFGAQKNQRCISSVTRVQTGNSGCNFAETIANPLAACQTAPYPPPPSPLQDLIPPEAPRAEGWSSESFTTDAGFHINDNSETANLSSSSRAMDGDNEHHSDGGGSQRQPSAEHTPQGTTAQVGGASQNPTPTSVQSSNTPSTGSGPATTNVTNTQNSKRRRGLGVVTPNACTECRKKRAKCDGKKPCGRCRAQKDVECVYEIPVRQSKENLRTEIETLRQKQRSSDQVLAALVRPELWEEVLTRLRSGQPIETISEWLASGPRSGGSSIPSFPSRSEAPTMGPAPGFPGGGLGTLAAMSLGAGHQQPQHPPMRHEVGQHSPWQSSFSQTGSTRSNSHPDVMNWQSDMRGQPQNRVGSWAEGMNPDQMSDGLPRYRGVEQILSPLNEPGLRTPASTWTVITNDSVLVQHLLALYFCWEYPTFASLSKEHFLQDFQEGRNRYCSPILVNALLALGCRFSTQPMSRANPNDPYTSGDHFFKESLRLFAQETDHHTLTTIQALGIMSIREASCGRDSESWYYAGQSIRLAIEMGLHRIMDEGDEDELAVQSATFWGAFALDHAWSLATGSLPQCSCFPHLPPKPAIIGDIEASLWVPYTDDGAPLQRSCQQPSNVRSVYKCFCELSELVHQSLYILHSPGKPLTARELLNMYTQYLNCKSQQTSFGCIANQSSMYYHFAILLLFRPLIKLRIIGSKVSPRDVCSQAADAIQGLLRSYSSLYTLRRTPSFVPYFVLTSAIIHLAIGATTVSSDTTEADMEKAAKVDPRVAESITQGISDLTEMAPCHQFAEQALNILRYLAAKWDIDVENNVDKLTAEEYDRLVLPHTGSLNFFSPNMRKGDITCQWGAGPFMSEQVQKAADNMENPLFWPFPMQGRPILPDGVELEHAGFAIL